MNHAGEPHGWQVIEKSRTAEREANTSAEVTTTQEAQEARESGVYGDPHTSTDGYRSMTPLLFRQGRHTAEQSPSAGLGIEHHSKHVTEKSRYVSGLKLHYQREGTWHSDDLQNKTQHYYYYWQELRRCRLRLIMHYGLTTICSRRTTAILANDMKDHYVTERSQFEYMKEAPGMDNSLTKVLWWQARK